MDRPSSQPEMGPADAGRDTRGADAARDTRGADAARNARSADAARNVRGAALVQEGEFRLELEASEDADAHSGYSIVVRGAIQSSSILSSTEPDETVTLLENDTKLVSGRLAGGTVGFVVDGTVVAAEFDEPAPAVKVGGAYVDPAQWPTVREYAGAGPGQDPVEDPFPGSAELGGARDDPLDPDEYVVEVEAGETAGPAAYCFDLDGEVLDRAGGATVSGRGDRVYGCLRPGESAEVTIRGLVTHVDTEDGLEFTVSDHDGAR